MISGTRNGSAICALDNPTLIGALSHFRSSTHVNPDLKGISRVTAVGTPDYVADSFPGSATGPEAEVASDSGIPFEFAIILGL